MDSQDKNEEHVLRGQHRHMRESATLYSLYESNHYTKTVAGDVKELRAGSGNGSPEVGSSYSLPLSLVYHPAPYADPRGSRWRTTL
jgi:hypothetical protein